VGAVLDREIDRAGDNESLPRFSQKSKRPLLTPIFR